MFASIMGGMVTLLLVGFFLLGGPWGIVAKIVSLPRVANWLITRAMKTPYYHIKKDDGKGNVSVYMERYWLFNPYNRGADGQEASKYPWFPWNIRLHWIRRHDHEEHMHDHPWNARTFILRGGYTEERPHFVIRNAEGKTVCEHPSVFIRAPGDTAKLGYGVYHRITYVPPGGAWTLFISGRYKGTWGFLVDGVKIKWKTYLGLK